MAFELLPRTVIVGVCGFRGSGGGALSGSELSHLLLVSFCFVDEDEMV
jgi:hypothetical protein